jgi:hypothetical protein
MRVHTFSPERTKTFFAPLPKLKQMEECSLKLLDCLIVRQPYASLIVYGAKRWEFRSYATEKKEVIAIAASRNTPIKTLDNKLNVAAKRFPRGVALGTAKLSKCFPVTQRDLRLNFKCCEEVLIHGQEFTVACEPIGEPPQDIKVALDRENWKKFVWELTNVKPFPRPKEYFPSRGSSWTKVHIRNEVDLTSFI